MPLNRIVSIFGFLLALCHFSHANYKVLLEADTGIGEFSKIGEIHFSNLKGDDVRVVNQIPLSRHTLMKTKETNEDVKFFKVRVSTQLQDISHGDLADNGWIMSFTTLDEILENNSLGELHLESDGLGNLISLNLIHSTAQNLDYSEDENLRFSTTVEARQPSQAIIPDTNGFLNKMEKERKIRDNPNKDNRSFLAKYWIYIVPICFFVIMQNAASAGQQ